MAALCWSSREEIPHIQGKRNPSKTVGIERGYQGADTLKPYSQKTSQTNHTRTKALSNSMKLSHAVRGHPRWAGHGGEVWQNVVHWRRERQTTSVFLPWKPHEQYEKAKRTLKDEHPRSVGIICYWRRVEKLLQEEWRDGAKAKTTPSCGCDRWWK